MKLNSLYEFFLEVLGFLCSDNRDRLAGCDTICIPYPGLLTQYCPIIRIDKSAIVAEAGSITLEL